MLDNETKDTELKKEALSATAAIAQTFVSGDLVPQVINIIKEVSKALVSKPQNTVQPVYWICCQTCGNATPETSEVIWE